MKQDIKDLLIKYRDGSISKTEMHLLETWYLKWTPEDDEIAFERLDELEKEIYNLLPKPNKQVKLWPRIAIAAAAVAAVVVGVYFFSYRNEILKQVQDDVVANDIAPGRNSATLTLANGKTINLSDAKTGVVIDASKLTYSDGTEIIQPSLPTRGISPGGRESNNRMITASTPRGGTYQVTLPDGTKVWLNADSKLVFPASFGGDKQRVVRLSGEGYFEVAKVVRSSPFGGGGGARGGMDNTTLSPRKGDLSRGERIERVPFIVITDKQMVTVLGTHFNISAYGDEGSVKTTLLEGSVRVNDIETSSAQAVILKPNQQSVIGGADGITVREIDAEDMVAWKNGIFIFNDEALPEVMRKISRWYNVEINYEQINRNKRFGGSVSRYDNVSKVLRKLEQTGGIHFKIEGRRITAMK
jgi:transmembrane sensor